MATKGLPVGYPQGLAFNCQEAMRFDFDFEGFLPRHLMTMFTVQRHPEIVDGLVWQNGVRLTSGAFHETQALAEADYFNRRFSLWVTGKQAGRYFAVLHDEVLQIVRRMEKLRYTEWLWLPEAARIEAEPVSPEWQPRARYRDMIAIEGRGGREYICEGGVYDLARVFGNIPKEARPGPVTALHIERVERMTMSGGDTFNMNGNFRGSVVNVRSTLREVTQTIQALSNQGEPQKRDLERLVADLTAALEQLPAAQGQQAEKIAKRVKQLVEEAASPEPDSDMLKVTAEGLKKAAEAVAGIAPTVVRTVKEIVTALFP